MNFSRLTIKMDQYMYLYEFSNLEAQIDLELEEGFIGQGLLFRRLSLDKCL